MEKSGRAIIEMDQSPESFRDRQELLAQRLALENRADVKYLFNGQAYLVTLEQAINGYSIRLVGERVQDLLKDLEYDAQKLLQKERFFKEEIEKEKKYAKMANEIKSFSR